MSLRALIVALITVSTIGFVVGTTIERNSKETHAEHSAVPRAGESSEAGGGETRGEAGGGETRGEQAHGELKPFGVNLESVPLIVAAALVSLGLAAAVWARSRSALALAVVAVVMLLFAVLDVREVFHQVDESRTGLAVLAGVVAVLHVGAAVFTALLLRMASGDTPSMAAPRPASPR